MTKKREQKRSDFIENLMNDSYMEQLDVELNGTAHEIKRSLIDAYAYNSKSLNNFKLLLEKYKLKLEEETKQYILCL